MTIRSAGRDASTDTCFGKLSTSHRAENDEMFAYVEITEALMTARSRHAAIGRAGGGGDKNLKLPMRKSLFAHVPPYIIFRDTGNTVGTTLPREITNHLFWWHRKYNFPGAIRSTVQKSGFTTTTDDTVDWCGTWCNTVTYAKLDSTNTFRKINRFPNSTQLSNKISLWKNVRRMRRKYGEENFDFMPKTFILPREEKGLWKCIKRNGGTWIIKPPASCAGNGITIVSQFYEIPGHLSLVAQRYISKPRLLDGAKFDIRLYVLLTSINPLRIYIYKEGLVRLATVKYLNEVSTLSDKFMHLTNTSINKWSPDYKRNTDPYKREGHMWSLNCLWNYLDSVEDVDTVKIWNEIKDIAIKTLISAESSLVKGWEKSAITTYNFYQLFGFDVLLDEKYRPWLLEVNDFPSMEPDTPLCGIVKGQLAKDYLSLVGFHVPDVLTAKELKTLKGVYGENSVCYNRQLYSALLSTDERKKQYIITRIASRKDCMKAILKNLMPDDVRVLIRHEDEIANTGQFERIFPTCNTYVYFRFFDKIRYYNLLLDAWENKHGRDRTKGIALLRKLCKRKYHLS